MDVEFVPSHPDESGAPDEVIAAGRPRRHPKLINAALALVVVAGGAGWFATRPDAALAPAPARTQIVHLPAGAPYGTDELAGCPDSLACDSNHQMQGHWLNLIREKMRQRPH